MLRTASVACFAATWWVTASAPAALFAVGALLFVAMGGKMRRDDGLCELSKQSVPTPQCRDQHPLFWTHVGQTSPAALERANSAVASVTENDLCSLKVHFIHKPTHEPWRETTGDYPYSDRICGRKRIWEFRVQLRFKRIPEDRSNLHFGLVLGGYVKVAGVARQVQKTLVHAIRSVVGNFYHSMGDDPAQTKGEVEPPTFVMPFCAFDQFVVSEPGQEPDILSDLSGQGLVRTDGIKQYVSAMRQTMDTLSEDKVYTFCFWGISRFLDCARWDICGAPGLAGLRLSFNQLCGQAPIYISIYSLERPASREGEKRHLMSMKKHYMNVALWTALAPPPPDVLSLLGVSVASGAESAAEPEPGDQGSYTDCLLSSFSCCMSRPHSPKTKKNL